MSPPFLGLYILLTAVRRNGDVISRPLLRSLVSLLESLSTQSLTSIFTTPFLASSRAYYKAEGIRLAATLEPSDYLRRINDRLAEEGERCDVVLGTALKGSVLRVVLEEMVTVHVEALVEKGASKRSRVPSSPILTRRYSSRGHGTREQDRRPRKHVLTARSSRQPPHPPRWFLGIHQGESLVRFPRPPLTSFQDTGLTMVMDKTADDKMVMHLIEFRTKAVNIVREAFGLDPTFAQAVTQAFEFFINKRENKPAEMMAKYLDGKLRTGNRGMDDADVEQTLNDVLFLFRFTQGKDIFEAYYKRDLAKRLLLNKSASFDAERSMLLKLKDGTFPMLLSL